MSAHDEINELKKAKIEAERKAGLEFDAKIRALEEKAATERKGVVSEVAKKILDLGITMNELADAGVAIYPPRFTQKYTDPVSKEVYVDDGTTPKPAWFVQYKASRKGKTASEIEVLEKQFNKQRA